MDHGKTVVAIIAAYKAVKSGYQMAIMAPTAILATQHMEEFSKILSQFDIKCELLISGISKKKKEDIDCSGDIYGFGSAGKLMY